MVWPMIRARLFRATGLVSLLSVAGCATTPKLNATGECLHEDFVNRVSAAGQCLVLDTYQSPRAEKAPLLVVFVHGDHPSNRGDRNLERLLLAIRSVSERNIVVVALTRPGYQNGRERSTGQHYYFVGDTYRPYIVESVAKAVVKLADRYNASKVAVIGHSGGGTILAAGLGVYAEFAPNLAVFIASNFNVPKWVKHRRFRNWPTKESLSPHQLTAKVSPEVDVVAVAGSADSNAIPEFAREYVQLMKNDGKNARYVEIPGAAHDSVLRDEGLWNMINDMLKELET